MGPTSRRGAHYPNPTKCAIRLVWTASSNWNFEVHSGLNEFGPPVQLEPPFHPLYSKPKWVYCSSQPSLRFCSLGPLPWSRATHRRIASSPDSRANHYPIATKSSELGMELRCHDGVGEAGEARGWLWIRRPFLPHAIGASVSRQREGRERKKE
ncbi:hypothetical protein TIFTF001_042819 [Ficus carica]|uniref:Uncharacterized protein n=1 Tax=Ficus carica TaxID=3494 RepID=A0AA87YNS5_FICCA|nr:hypothetical protein TIFTF001_042817 [Ficus carica]GMN19113.1 hypothetical protein TIFTF001_042819 [Ficus carica]